MQDRIRVALLSVCLSAWATIVVSAPAAAWEYPGHRIVGAIADLILQRHYPATQKRVSDLLDVQVWLLAHLVGDIHQPLHVGTKYFKGDCETSVDPNEVGTPPKFGIGETIAQTVGGNLIYLDGPAPGVPLADNLHLFWDGATVVRAMQAAGVAQSEQDFAKLVAATVPGGWETAGAPETWAAQWATEILPLAVEAHNRLTIRKRPFSFPSCTWTTTLDPTY